MTITSMDRRALLQRAMLVVGAAMVPGGAEALAQAVSSGARQLDTAHYALLTALADTIIPKTGTPGAVEAGVPQVVDALLGSWASPPRRAELIAALETVDRLAQQQMGKSFAALSPADREAVLTPYDAAALKPAPPSPPPAIPIAAGPVTADPSHARPRHEPPQTFMDKMSPHYADPGYGKLKELIVVAFYYSQTALTHDLAYEQIPGQWLPSIPITPGTRPWGGVNV